MIIDGDSLRVIEIDSSSFISGISKKYNISSQDQAAVLSLVYEDGLTGLKNYKYFREKIREKAEVSVMCAVLDIDKFKNVNDVLGHDAGNKVLKHFGTSLAAAAKTVSAEAIRYGGEEFVVLQFYASGGDTASARSLYTMLASLRQNLTDNPLRIAGRLVRISFSAGICRGLDIKPADMKLNEIKKAGRNRIGFAYIDGVDASDVASILDTELARPNVESIDDFSEPTEGRER